MAGGDESTSNEANSNEATSNEAASDQGGTTRPGPTSPLGDATVISNRPEPSDVPGASAATPSDVGRILEGKRLGHFELERFIGGGGMGAVFYGTDMLLGRPVAIKVLLSHFAHDDETVQRFHNEAQSAARLDHENVARVYFVGVDRGWHYMVHEFIDGENLRDRVQRQGPLPLSEVVSYTLQIAEALAHASGRDVVHRDIKPSNVLVDAEGHVKLVDMGLARLHQVETSHDDLTATGMTLGTFDYIAPEQARDPRSADVRSDLYSLGCTFYFMLTGRPPFLDGTVLQKLLQHQNDAPPDPRQFRPNLPEPVCNVAGQLLAKNPDDRYQDPHQLIADLLIVSEQLKLPKTSTRTPIWISPSIEQSGWSRKHLPWLVPLGLLLIVGAMIHYWAPRSIEQPRTVGAGIDIPQHRADWTNNNPRQPVDSSNTAASKSDQNGNTPNSSSGGVGSISDSKTVRQPLASGASERASNGSTTPLPVDNERVSNGRVGNGDFHDDGSRPSGGGSAKAVGPEERKSISAAPANGGNRGGVKDETLLVVTSNPMEDRQYATLADACRIAISGDVIELRYDGRLDHPEKPITIADRKLTIRGGEGFQPIVRFRPTGPDRVLYPRSMIHVAGGELLLSNVHLELEIPVQVRSENWSLFETVLANRIRLLGCTMTIRNADGNHAALYQNVSFFHTKAAPQRVRTMLGDVQDPLPRLQLQLRDCVARGEAVLLRGSALDTVQLQWDNGLVAISEPFVVLQGQSASLPLGAQLEIDLKHVTCLARSGFCRMLSSEDQRHLPTVRFDCSDSILIMANTPLVDQVGRRRLTNSNGWFCGTRQTTSMKTFPSTGTLTAVITRKSFRCVGETGRTSGDPARTQRSSDAGSVESRRRSRNAVE